MTRRSAEDGELSDGGDSLEEITAEDFGGGGGGRSGRGDSRSRVWMSDLMRHPLSRNFAPDLYNFAWAQAVQNKPLLMPEDTADDDDSEEKGGDDEDEEKEEGELEEGEIELGSEPPALDGKVDSLFDKTDKDLEVNVLPEKELEEDRPEEIGEFDMRVSLILEELETVTKEETEASFDAVCARLRKSFESLKQMHTESSLPVVDALVQQAFMGMQTVHSVVISSKLKKNEDLLLRLLVHIKNQYSILLTADQLKELDAMVQSLVYSENKGSNTGGISSHSLVSLEKPYVEPRAVGSAVSVVGKAGLPKLETPTAAWNRGDFSPLLDLHADYDEGSLPSPTRDNAQTLTLQNPIGFRMEAAFPAQPIPSQILKVEGGKFQPYDTDAFKAVSSYQQKYSRTSFPTINQLPSPTPSEDNDGNDDIHGEVSSAPVVDTARTFNSASTSEFLRSSGSGACTTSSSCLPNAPVKTVGQLVSGPSTVFKASAKSRDPRLRALIPEVGGTSDQNRLSMPVNSLNGFSVGLLNSRKNKAIEESMLDDQASKRQKIGLTNRDIQVTPGRGGWLEESNVPTSQSSGRNVDPEIRKPGNGEIVSNRIQNASNNFNGINVGNGQNFSMAPAPAVSTCPAPAVSLPSLLKDIAVNPTMLMQLFQMEQQRIAALSQQKATGSVCDPISISNANRFRETVSAENSFKSSERDQNSADKSQLPAQTVTANAHNDVGRVRMKPRDPRRILHNNSALKNESLKSELSKINGNPPLDTLSSKDRLAVREQGEQAQTTGLPSQPAPQPDISRMLTKNLMNLADMTSSPPSTDASRAAPQNTSQPIPGKTNKVDVTAATAELNGQKVISGVNSEGSTAGASQVSNPWGDVEHLMDGFDDQQKAAIQRERARRIEEQNKMFAARKLCLVLDLDHTLLNSAKFVEVDPIHDEILRKKEEQDREKPHRHLFRFQHMGMWTKLRPGVWTFLERASKLFEMHLYTMGNHLYATEMAKVLDPTGALFAGRVISRGDDSDPFDGDERVPKSKDLDGVLGLESAVVIIDDSVRVWPHNKLNLIVVERYTYFPCSRRQFGLPGPSLLEIDRDERPEAGTLASSLAVIERIHHNFFSHRSLNEVDVRNILAAEQRRILAGCKIVFSRIFPVGESNPHMHPLWQTAEQFGAICTNLIDEQVTHVVANSLGTDKVNWAISTGRFVVQPGWVEASALLYRRANEHEFAVKI